MLKFFISSLERKLHVLNPTAPGDSALIPEFTSAPEYLLGSYIARLDNRKSLLSELSSMTRNNLLIPEELAGLLSSLQDDTVDVLPDEALDSLFAHLRVSQSSYLPEAHCRSLDFQRRSSMDNRVRGLGI
jgi:hypothetical protein